MLCLTKDDSLFFPVELNQIRWGAVHCEGLTEIMALGSLYSRDNCTLVRVALGIHIKKGSADLDTETWLHRN